jgi:hypothetical protein
MTSVIFSGRTNKAVEHHEMWNYRLGPADYYISCCPLTASHIDKVIELYKPKGVCIDPIEHSIPGPVSVLSMHYNRKRAFDMIQDKPNRVISTRFDMYINDNIHICDPCEDKTIYVPAGEDHGGLNDRLAYGNYESMKIYCHLYDYIHTLSHPELHPETILKEYVDITGLNVVRFPSPMKLYSSTVR